MIVSWNWLKQYVDLDMSVAELEERLMMAGLNHERTDDIDGDLAVDLEVTSNRPDCLGHLGVAREVSVLWDKPLRIPPAVVEENGPAVDGQVRVRIDCPELCFRYTARVVRGVRIGPSPTWMTRRLETVGITPINNVVDISNYVLMECGQPLHTFDFAKLEGAQIVVREPKQGETIQAIDHKTYALSPGMCVIADSRRPVAIGGVMGGAQTEISRSTRDILVEAAEFDPVAIRTAARTLNLHSDSSYRFERRIDAENLDWASRRCCELILELAGGQLCQGVVDVGPPPAKRQPITLRLAQIRRVLGIDVPVEKVRKILAALGNEELRAGELRSETDRVEVIPPSWRRDLTREIDLIEEVARIHGYDAIPQDVGVPMVASARRPEDRVAQKVRRVLTAWGYDEALTLSVVDEATAGVFSPWTNEPPLASMTPILRGADRLRTSLIPSLLGARRTNQSLANNDADLFETARVYLPQGDKLPEEPLMLGLVSHGGFADVKGAIESIVAALNPASKLEASPVRFDLLDRDRACRLTLDGAVLGYLGEVSAEGLKRFDLRQPASVAEVRMDALLHAAKLVPQYQGLPLYPAVTRDLNLVVDESVRWADVAETVRLAAEAYFESLDYVDTYRDDERLGQGKKSLLMTLTLRWSQGTMTSQEADRIRDAVVAACGKNHAAELRA